MTKNILRMPARSAQKHPDQGEFSLIVDKQIEADGVGMGVLRDGVPFLNQRGLARLCGVENRYIGIISSEWLSEAPSERTRRVREIVAAHGESVPLAAHEASFQGRRVLAYPDNVCMAALEYYAFEADLSGAEIALRNYRRLARHGLRQFIYEQVGYAGPVKTDVWRIFKDRVSLTYDAVPAGYFGVFKELASLIVTLGLSGIHIDENFVPDISVGQAWSRYWDGQDLAKRYGTRGAYPHNYPAYFPQAASNPQMAACYPESALGEFRKWFRDEYIGSGRFRSYLVKKAETLSLSREYIESALLALTKHD